MSGSNNNVVSDMLTDKAKWLASVIRPLLKDTSDDAHSALFHTIREHYGMLSAELLYEVLRQIDNDEATSEEASSSKDL